MLNQAVVSKDAQSKIVLQADEEPHANKRLSKNCQATAEQVRIFECDACQKRFTTKFSLKRHQQLHVEISGASKKEARAKIKELKPLKCAYCPKRFSLKQYLKEHEYTHTGQRPHVCGINGCTKSFRQAGKLSLHRRKHPEYQKKEYFLANKASKTKQENCVIPEKEENPRLNQEDTELMNIRKNSFTAPDFSSSKAIIDDDHHEDDEERENKYQSRVFQHDKASQEAEIGLGVRTARPESEVEPEIFVKPGPNEIKIQSHDDYYFQDLQNTMVFQDEAELGLRKKGPAKGYDSPRQSNRGSKSLFSGKESAFEEYQPPLQVLDPTSPSALRDFYLCKAQEPSFGSKVSCYSFQTNVSDEAV